MSTATIHALPEQGGTIAAALDRWDRVLRRRIEKGDLGERTRVGYLQAVADFAKWLEVEARPTTVASVNIDTVESWTDYLLSRPGRGGKGKASQTRAHNLQVVLKGFFKFCTSKDMIESNPFTDAGEDIVIHAPEVQVEPLTVEEQDALFATCTGKTFEDRRDRAIFLVWRDTGIRRAEMVGLTLDRLDLDEQQAEVWGKGRKWRTIVFSAETAEALDDYMDSRRLVLRQFDTSTDALWVTNRGSTPGQAMTHSGIGHMVTRRAERAGLENVHPHRWRHAFVDSWLDEGRSEQNLATLAGWSSTRMCSHYAKATAAKRALKDARSRFDKRAG